MGIQWITTESGERLVVMPEAEYRALLAAAEETADRDSLRAFRAKLARGEEEWVPAAVADRLIAGENPIRVWREHRRMTLAELAQAAGIATAYLSQMETGKRTGRIETLKSIATALKLTVDDIVVE